MYIYNYNMHIYVHTYTTHTSNIVILILHSKYIYALAIMPAYQMYLYNFLIIVTGNFGVVYMAWCTKDDIRVKVAIKTVKGNCFVGNNCL